MKDMTMVGMTKAASIASVFEAEAVACEDARTMTKTAEQAMWDSGVMNYLNPKEAGGEEPCFADLIETWAELARADGSSGWTAMANMSTTMACAVYLNDQGFEQMFGSNDRMTTAGQLFPNGMGTATSGGFDLTGAWNFGSGIGHSPIICAGFMKVVDGEPLLDLDQFSVAAMPADQVTITDGWHVQGLRGTGSYDYRVDEVHVPEHMTFALFSTKPHRGSSTMYRMGLMPVTAAGHAAWALGVAKSMLDDVAELAKSKVRMSDMETLALRQTFQRNLSHHLGMWRAAHQGVLTAFSQVEAAVASGETLTPTMRADLGISATYATEACREICQWAHLAAGTSAVREGGRLERAFRDMYTGSQHAFISEKTYIDAAQIILGLVDDLPGV